MDETSITEKYFHRVLRSSLVRTFGSGGQRSLLTWLYCVVVPGLSLGVVGTLVTDFLIKSSDKAPVNWLIVFALSLLILIFSGLFFSVLKLISVYERQKTHDVSISRRDGGGQSAFEYCASITQRATKSIYVIGPHFTGGNGAVGEDVSKATTKDHSEYLEKAMNQALERAQSVDPERSFEGHQFTYFRVVQYDPTNLNPDFHSTGKLYSRSIGDAALARHLDVAMKCRNKTDGLIQLNLWARPYVPSMPSILVVDERYVFFSLPTYASASDGAKPVLDYNFVFEVEDRSGNVPRHFIRMITQLTAADAQPIESLLLETATGNSEIVEREVQKLASQ